MDRHLANGAAQSASSPRAAAFHVDLPTTDDPSLEAVLRASLEEAVTRGEHLQGKAREGAPLTAEQLAVQLHIAELEAALRSALDSQLARSIDRAVDEDAQMVQFFQEVEEREREDRLLAMEMSRPSSRMSIVYPIEAAQSAVRVLDCGPPVERRTEVASTSGPLRIAHNTNASAPCVACGEAIFGRYYVKAPCNHFYDVQCITDLIRHATTDEALYPPRCCKLPLHAYLFNALIPSDVREAFEKKSLELSTPTKDRRYCPQPTCSSFLGSAQTFGSSVTCPSCKTVACTHCRKAAHPERQFCEPDDDTAVVGALMKENSWQRCPECHAVVELTFGCNHINCRCKAEFCYECAMPWKTCQCDQWVERRLFVEAERRVAAEAIAHGAPLGEGGVLDQQPIQEAAERRQRVFEVAERLRTHHDCDHRWRRRPGSGHCGGCGKYMKYFLMECRECWNSHCRRCAFNRL